MPVVPLVGLAFACTSFASMMYIVARACIEFRASAVAYPLGCGIRLHDCTILHDACVRTDGTVARCDTSALRVRRGAVEQTVDTGIWVGAAPTYIPLQRRAAYTHRRDVALTLHAGDELALVEFVPIGGQTLFALTTTQALPAVARIAFPTRNVVIHILFIAAGAIATRVLVKFLRTMH